MGRHELSQALETLAAALAQLGDHPALVGLSDPANLATAAAHELDHLTLDLVVARGRRWGFTGPSPDGSG